MSQTLIAKLAQVRRKQAMVFSVTGISIAVGFIILAFAIEMLVDWGIEWPWADAAGLSWTVRAGILAIILAGLVWIVLNRIISPWVFGPDDEALALAVEREEIDLGGRLIASVQLSQPEALAADASRSLVAALVRQTEQMVESRDFDSIIRMDSLVRAGSIALLIMIVGGMTFALCRPGSAALLNRALLGNSPVPRKTHVVVITGDIRVPKGESVTIVAEAEGIKPASGTIDIAFADAGYSFSLDPDPAVKGRYSRKIENVTASFTYAIHLNDGRSDRRYKVEAVDRPIAVSMDCVQIFPDYIKQPQTHHLPGDLSVVAGSRLLINVKSNKPLARTSPRQFPFNHVHLTGSEKDYPLDVDNQDLTRAVTAPVSGRPGIPLPKGTTGISVYLVDTDGIESKAPTVFRVELLADKPPVIRMISSSNGREELVTRIASPHVVYEAFDDYGIGKLSLCYSVNNGPQQEIPLTISPQDFSQLPPPPIKGSYDFSLVKITPPPGQATLEGSSVQYWLHAEDMNNVSNPNQLPGMCDSERCVLKVVTEEEKRRELMGRADILPEQLAPISEGEKQSSDSLGNLIIGGGATTQPDKP